MNLPWEKWSRQAAAIAIVGALRTKTLTMDVPSFILSVARAAGGEGGELVAAVALGEPEGVVAELVGESAALDDFQGGHVLAAEAYA